MRAVRDVMVLAPPLVISEGEIDELVECILDRRETHLNVHDAQKTMEICIAADRSAARGGRPVRLPLIR